jgi:SAM-dependent methyltransferase
MKTLARYDEAPYVSVPWPDAHPDRLFTLARLMGLDPPPPDRAQVLELGCATGGNLLPLALNWPAARFVGLDLSERQIAMGRADVQAMGADNLTLVHAGVEDVDASWDRFDYIICHGLYSWAPPEIRDRIVAVCRQKLTDNGVAYIDYNTYPGWAPLETLRKLMRLHTQGLNDPRQAVSQALAILDFLSHFTQTADADYAAFLKKEIQRLTETARQPDGWVYIFHEYLEDNNQPVYFHQFAERIQRHGLQYLGEAVYAHMGFHGYPDEVAEVLGGLGDDRVQIEQYMDFLRNRRFRRSLLVQSERQPADRIDSGRIPEFQVAVTSEVDPDLIAQAPGGDIGRAALMELLDRRPKAIGFEELLGRARTRLDRPSPDPDQDRRRLAEDLAACYPYNLLQFVRTQAEFTLSPGPRPQLAPLALHQARQGQMWLTNQVHEPAILPPAFRPLLPLLDGEHHRAALVDELQNRLDRGEIQITAAAGSSGSKPTRAVLEQTLDHMLDQIAAKALLIV